MNGWSLPLVRKAGSLMADIHLQRASEGLQSIVELLPVASKPDNE
jgi:hypothetical protein